VAAASAGAAGCCNPVERPAAPPPAVPLGVRVRDDALRQLGKLRALGEKALAQMEDEAFFTPLDPEGNSVALIVKHLAGNMRSRWRDFLTTDGEKPDRERDREFVEEPGDTRDSLRAAWNEGWELALGAVGALGPDDLERIVRIRGEPHTALEAINRQLTHYAYHVGQIVLLAKHFAGPAWSSLSIPKGASREYEVAKDGVAYRPGSAVKPTE